MSEQRTSAPVSIHRWTRPSIGFAIVMVGVVVALALVPEFFTQDTTEKLTELFILIILASMWNVLAGFGGMVSIGQQAFIGIGAYATIIFNEHGVSPYMACVLAALFAGVASLPISLVAFRLRGGQFAVGMWVIAEIFRLLVTNTQSLGGQTGKSLTALNVYAPADRQAYTYWLALAFTVVLLGASFALLRSRTGAALQAIRDDEGAAESVGVKVTRAKRIVFVLAGAGCGAAGAITLANLLNVTASGAFSIQYTAFMIFMVLIGGLGTFEGPVLGAFILFGLQQQFADQGSWYLVGLGVVAILVTLLFPRGLWGALVDRFNIHLIPVGYHLRGLPATALPTRPPGGGPEPAAPE